MYVHVYVQERRESIDRYTIETDKTNSILSNAAVDNSYDTYPNIWLYTESTSRDQELSIDVQ